jgi:hypothetical protein
VPQKLLNGRLFHQPGRAIELGVLRKSLRNPKEVLKATRLALPSKENRPKAPGSRALRGNHRGAHRLWGKSDQSRTRTSNLEPAS